MDDSHKNTFTLVVFLIRLIPEVAIFNFLQPNQRRSTCTVTIEIIHKYWILWAIEISFNCFPCSRAAIKIYLL